MDNELFYEATVADITFRYNANDTISNVMLSLYDTLKNHFKKTISGGDIIPYCEEIEYEFLPEEKLSNITTLLGNNSNICLIRLFVDIEAKRAISYGWDKAKDFDEVSIINLTLLIKNSIDNKGVQ